MKRLLLILLGGLTLLVALVLVAGFISLRQHALPKTPITSGAPDGQPGTYRVQLEFQGRQRDYLLHLPPAVASGTPLPLVMALHGAGGDAIHLDALVKLNPLADAQGFLVVFPDGVARGWADGRPSDGTKGVDDVAFLEAVIDDVARTAAVDSQRVYVTGISNGGFMAGRLACDAADRIAAVAIIAATGPTDLRDGCQPSRPISVLAFNGTKDPTVPYGGGHIRFLMFKQAGALLSADALRAFWVQQDGCDPTLQTMALPDVDHGDGSTVTRIANGGCQGGADVVFYRIDGGGHTWPGGAQYLPVLAVGHANRDIDATALLWGFFEAHPLPPPATTP